MLKSFMEQLWQNDVDPIINDKQKWQIYTSPMRRCLLTTKALAHSGIPITVKKDMYESGGCYKYDENGQAHAYPGSTGQEIEEEFKGYVCDEAIPMDKGWYTRRSKETWREFEIRSGELVEWLWSLMEQQTHEGIFFVGHGNLISAIINGLMFETPKNALFIHNNCGLTHLKLTKVNGTKRVVVLQTHNKNNYIATSHLTGHRAIEDHWLNYYIINMIHSIYSPHPNLASQLEFYTFHMPLTGYRNSNDLDLV